MPNSTVSFMVATCSTRSVGSSAQNTPNASLAFCASASVSAVMARPYMGSGSGVDSRRVSYCSWASCSTASKNTSSARGIAQMSPQVTASASVCSAPLSFRRCATFRGLRASPTNSWPPRRTAPWWTRKMAMRPRKGSMSTCTTCATACPSGSGDTGTGSACGPATKVGGLPSFGDGISRSNTPSSSASPAPVSAETKQTGTRCPSRSAVSKASCNWSEETSPCSRYASISSSSHLHHLVDDLLMGRRHGAEVGLGVLLPEKDIDNARPAVGRQVDRQALGPEGRLDLVEYRRRVRTLCIDLGDHDHPAQPPFAGGIHHPLRHHLDARRGVHDHRRGLHGREYRQRASLEVGMTRRVEQIDMHAAMVEVTERRGQGVLQLLLVRVGVGNRRAGVHGTLVRDLSGRVQQRFGELGLTRAAVSDQRDIANFFGGVGHVPRYLPAWTARTVRHRCAVVLPCRKRLDQPGFHRVGNRPAGRPASQKSRLRAASARGPIVRC